MEETDVVSTLYRSLNNIVEVKFFFPLSGDKDRNEPVYVRGLRSYTVELLNNFKIIVVFELEGRKERKKKRKRANCSSNREGKTFNITYRYCNTFPTCAYAYI